MNMLLIKCRSVATNNFSVRWIILVIAILSFFLLFLHLDVNVARSFSKYSQAPSSALSLEQNSPAEFTWAADERAGRKNTHTRLEPEQEPEHERPKKPERSDRIFSEAMNASKHHLHIPANPLRPVKYPWANRTGCSHFNISFAMKGTSPNIALTSYPGSGNTWVRYLLEGITGIFTGDIYRDTRLGRQLWGSKVSYRSGSTFCIKTHHPEFENHIPRLHKVLMVVRNPFDAFCSFFHYAVAHSHVRKASPAAFRSDKFLKFAAKYDRWGVDITSWLDKYGGAKVGVFHYERLVRRLGPELQKVADFLDIDLDQKRLDCLLQDAEGMFHRKTPIKSMFPFTTDQARPIINKICEVDAILVRENKTRIPTSEYADDLAKKYWTDSQALKWTMQLLREGCPLKV